MILRATIRLNKKKKKYLQKQGKTLWMADYSFLEECVKVCILLLLFVSSCYLIHRTTYRVPCAIPPEGKPIPRVSVAEAGQLLTCVSPLTASFSIVGNLWKREAVSCCNGSNAERAVCQRF